jgi:cysteinyl-tRNA synthetase
MIFQDEDLSLMPYFFDRLRKHAIFRKKWRKNLNFAERMYERVQNIDQRLLVAFRTWHKVVIESKKYLEATARPVLVDRFFKNRMIMNHVAEVVEDKIQTTEVMTEQRNVLFTGYVGG